jgi:4'-phosphopantetheinyl transferase EntD
VDRRRREFTAGRLSARAALRRLGVAEAPLLSNPDRTPRWPAGVVGSISHCRGFCAVVVARREHFAGLGLDVELADPLRPAVAARVCRPGELESLAGVAPPPGSSWEKIVFSAKESTYKCYYPLARTFLGFHDVEVRVWPETGAFRASLVREDAPSAAGARVFHGRFACDGSRVFSGVTLPARGAGRA